MFGYCDGASRQTDGDLDSSVAYGMAFGTDNIRCLQDFKQPSPKGEALCIANKLTFHGVIFPVALRDDGYVLGVKGTSKYYLLPEARIAALQAAGALPRPMPPYTIGIADYVCGYLLWIFLAVTTAIVVAKVWKARRIRKAILNASGTVGNVSPVIRTEGDQFIVNQVAPVLRPWERVSHQAFARPNVAGALITLGGKAHFVVLTNERIILIETRAGLLGARLENHGVESIERSALGAVTLGADGVLRILVPARPWRLVIDPRQRRFSNQVAFLRDLPRLFPLRITRPDASSSAAGA